MACLFCRTIEKNVLNKEIHKKHTVFLPVDLNFIHYPSIPTTGPSTVHGFVEWKVSGWTTSSICPVQQDMKRKRQV